MNDGVTVVDSLTDGFRQGDPSARRGAHPFGCIGKLGPVQRRPKADSPHAEFHQIGQVDAAGPVWFDVGQRQKDVHRAAGFLGDSLDRPEVPSSGRVQAVSAHLSEAL